MYNMKNINNNIEVVLPQCMYRVKNSTEYIVEGDLSNQVKKFLKPLNYKMTELVQRQDSLLKKLDILYDRIKTISLNCKVDSYQDRTVKTFPKPIPTPEEIVLVLSPDNLPWYLNILLKTSSIAINIKWHIHSSVPNEKVAKVLAFVEKLQCAESTMQVNLRLIFKCGAADSELKLSSLAVPIVGNVNILRYLSYAYPSIISYDQDDFFMDYLLDLCHLLERTPEKNKEALVNKLFSQYKMWIYGNDFTIVDLAAYNVIKQSRNIHKNVPKVWLDQCNAILCF